jgi:hypothetical protein
VVGLVIREYWLNPDFLTRKQNNEIARQQPDNSTLSDEDQAIAADIDNLPVLLNDSERARLAAIANTPKENPQQKTNKSIFADVFKPKSAANDAKSNAALGVLNAGAAPKEQNLFISQAENLLQMGTSYSNSPLLGIKSSVTSVEQPGLAATAANQWIGLPNQTDNNQNTVVISPLQAAINQSTNQSISGGFNRVTSGQTNIIESTNYGGTTLTPPMNGLPNPSLPASTTSYNQPTVTNLPPNSFNNIQVLPSVAPVAPPVTSMTPNNLDPYSPQTANQNLVTPTNPSVSENYGNSALQQPTLVPPSNSPRPRPTPGAYGGIEINGYRYP